MDHNVEQMDADLEGAFERLSDVEYEGDSDSDSFEWNEIDLQKLRYLARKSTYQVTISNIDGEEYSFYAPPTMSVKKLKEMAVGHFFTPSEAVGTTSSADQTSQNWSEGKSNSDNYRLLLTRGSRNLSDDRNIGSEALEKDDIILLLERRRNSPTLDNASSQGPNLDQIWQATSHLTPKNMDRSTEFQLPTLDFKIALRKILLTMIKVSAHLISGEENCVDIFVKVFEQLEKKHQPRVDVNSLKQLTEMGFDKVKASHALFIKRNVQSAMDWLLDEKNKEFSELELDNALLTLSAEQKKEYFLGGGKDPADAVLEQLNIYIKKWFQPDLKAVQALKNLGYSEDVAKEALRSSNNNELASRNLLEGDSSLVEEIQKGFDRESPIMVGILESPVVQMAMSKPKILYSLMAMYESPSSSNIWLSDPETHPIVSQVLRIYHAEKHRLGSEGNSALRMISPLNPSNASAVGSYLPSDVSDPQLYITLQNVSRHTTSTDSTSNNSRAVGRTDPNMSPSQSVLRRIQPTSPYRLANVVPSISGTSSTLQPAILDQGPSPSAARLSVTYYPPTTEGELSSLTLRLERRSGSEEQQSNNDEERSENSDFEDMETQ